MSKRDMLQVAIIRNLILIGRFKEGFLKEVNWLRIRAFEVEATWGTNAPWLKDIRRVWGPKEGLHGGCTEQGRTYEAGDVGEARSFIASQVVLIIS